MPYTIKVKTLKEMIAKKVAAKLQEAPGKLTRVSGVDPTVLDVPPESGETTSLVGPGIQGTSAIPSEDSMRDSILGNVGLDVEQEPKPSETAYLGSDPAETDDNWGESEADTAARAYYRHFNDTTNYPLESGQEKPEDWARMALDTLNHGGPGEIPYFVKNTYNKVGSTEMPHRYNELEADFDVVEPGTAGIHNAALRRAADKILGGKK